MNTFVQEALNNAQSTLNNFVSEKSNIELIGKAIDLLVNAYTNDGKAISCGNGGSMCDAMHFAEELTGRFRSERRPLPAVAVSDASHISCTANDYGFDFIFSRYVEAWGKSNDVLLAISTSGNSQNIINAVEVAKKSGVKTIGLLGKDGGKLKDMVDVPLIVPAHTSDRVQEVHIKIIHIVIEGVERALFPENY